MNLRELLEELRRMRDQSATRHGMAWALVLVSLLVRPVVAMTVLYFALHYEAAPALVRELTLLVAAFNHSSK